MRRKRIGQIKDEERKIGDPEKARARTTNRAVRLLAAKPRSERELTERLLESPWTDRTIVNAVVEKLKGYGYIDDERYAGDLALSRLRQKPQGKRRLKLAMSQKKLEAEVVRSAVESAFEKMPESELIDSAIEKRLSRKGVPATREDLKRFFDHLLRLGFEYDLIRERMTDLKGRIKTGEEG